MHSTVYVKPGAKPEHRDPLARGVDRRTRRRSEPVADRISPRSRSTLPGSPTPGASCIDWNALLIEQLLEEARRPAYRVALLYIPAYDVFVHEPAPNPLAESLREVAARRGALWLDAAQAFAVAARSRRALLRLRRASERRRARGAWRSCSRRSSRRACGSVPASPTRRAERVRADPLRSHRAGRDHHAEPPQAAQRVDRPHGRRGEARAGAGGSRTAAPSPSSSPAPGAASAPAPTCSLLHRASARARAPRPIPAELARRAGRREHGRVVPRHVHVPALHRKPIIAAINGPVAGMAIPIVACCDLRFAGPTRSFTTSFSRRGLVAEWGSSWILPRLIGPAHALDLLFSARASTPRRRRASGW